MKILPIALLIALPASGWGQAKKPAAPQFRDAATHDQLVSALKRSKFTDPMESLKKAEGTDPSKENQPEDLLAQSDVISFGEYATLVPKRAILSAPARLKERVKLAPGTRILGWSEFFRLNRGWITTVEVSRVQAEGNKPISEDTRESISKSPNLVVATYQGGPISVLPLKETKESNPTADPAQATVSQP
jgi:hypothetical protein